MSTVVNVAIFLVAVAANALRPVGAKAIPVTPASFMRRTPPPSRSTIAIRLASRATTALAPSAEIATAAGLRALAPRFTERVTVSAIGSIESSAPLRTATSRWPLALIAIAVGVPVSCTSPTRVRALRSIAATPAPAAT